MNATACILPDGRPVEWALWTNNSTVAHYSAVLFDPENNVIEQWDHQRTDDEIPDKFAIRRPAAAIGKCRLFWQARVLDPSHSGRAFTTTVVVRQNGTVIAEQTAEGEIPTGVGRLDTVGNEIVFVT